MGKVIKLEIFRILSTFTLFVYSLLLIYTVYVNLIYSLKTQTIDLFFPCIFLSFVELVLAIYFTGILNYYNEFAEFSKKFHLFFILSETLTVCIFYLRETIHNKMDMKIWILLLCLFFITIFLAIFNVTSYYISLVLFEFFIINTCSISIYFSAIKNKDFNLKQDKFIINNGLFIFINFTAPYFIIDESIDSNYFILSALKFINSIGYCIFFISNILSIKWKIKNLPQS